MPHEAVYTNSFHSWSSFQASWIVGVSKEASLAVASREERMDVENFSNEVLWEQCSGLFDPVAVAKEHYDRARFFKLLEQWDLQKGFTSSQDKIETCPAHFGILAMGWDAVPLIMEQIENGIMNHWFTVLGLITCEDPVRAEDRGNYSKMGKAWLKWWKEQN